MSVAQDCRYRLGMRLRVPEYGVLRVLSATPFLVHVEHPVTMRQFTITRAEADASEVLS